MYCPGYDNIRNELHSLLSTHDVVFKSLNDEDEIKVFTYPGERKHIKISGLIHIFNVSEEKRHSTFKI